VAHRLSRCVTVFPEVSTKENVLAVARHQIMADTLLPLIREITGWQ